MNAGGIFDCSQVLRGEVNSVVSPPLFPALGSRDGSLQRGKAEIVFAAL